MHWCRAVKVMVKGLRLAFEEGEEAGCDRDVIDNCCGLSLFSWSCTVEICWNPFVDSISKLVSGRRVYSELRIFTAVGNRIPPIANPLRRKAENRSSLLRGKSNSSPFGSGAGHEQRFVTITSAAQLKLNEAAQRLAEETARKAAERAAAKAQRVLKHLKWRLSHDANYGDQYNDQDKIG